MASVCNYKQKYFHVPALWPLGMVFKNQNVQDGHTCGSAATLRMVPQNCCAFFKIDKRYCWRTLSDTSPVDHLIASRYIRKLTVTNDLLGRVCQASPGLQYAIYFARKLNSRIDFLKQYIFCYRNTSVFAVSDSTVSGSTAFNVRLKEFDGSFTSSNSSWKQRGNMYEL